MTGESVVSHKQSFVGALRVQNQAIGWLRKGCVFLGVGTVVRFPPKWGVNARACSREDRLAGKAVSVLYAINQGVRIHYRVEGSGPPLVLQHGILWSVEGWYRVGYVDALRPNYRLILVDARGHGASDKPHDGAAYSLPQHVADIVAVLDALDLPKAHFWGYSMGGWFGFGMAKYAAARVDSLILGGAHPYEGRLPVASRPDGADPEAFLDTFFQIMGLDRAAFSPAEKAEFLDNDFRAIAACRQDRPSLGDILPTMKMPCLLYAGEEDGNFSQAQECVEHIPRGRFVSIPGVNHPEAFYRAKLVLPHAMNFLQTVAKG